MRYIFETKQKRILPIEDPEHRKTMQPIFGAFALRDSFYDIKIQIISVMKTARLFFRTFM